MGLSEFLFPGSSRVGRGDQPDKVIEKWKNISDKTLIVFGGGFCAIFFLTWLSLSALVILRADKSPVSENAGFFLAMKLVVFRAAVASIFFGLVMGSISVGSMRLWDWLSNGTLRFRLWLEYHLCSGELARKALRNSAKAGPRFVVPIFGFFIGVLALFIICTPLYMLTDLDGQKWVTIFLLVVLSIAVVVVLVSANKWAVSNYTALVCAHVSKKEISKYTIIQMSIGIVYVMEALLVIAIEICALLLPFVVLWGQLLVWEFDPLLKLAAEQSGKSLVEMECTVRESFKIQTADLYVLCQIFLVGGIVLGSIYAAICILPVLKLLNRKIWYCSVLGVGVLFAWGGGELLSRWIPTVWGSVLGLALSLFLGFALDSILGLWDVLTKRRPKDE